MLSIIRLLLDGDKPNGLIKLLIIALQVESKMKKFILLCLLAGSAILAPVLTYADSPSAPSSGPVCVLTSTGEHCVMPFFPLPKPIIPIPPYIPPAN
ncbi:hypothetical protein [Xenorhabdus hominickii]|uniref:hypothetical protein n=1 Tax=Xenorhabdus hominickii TaxID=351679 RepID=UPI0011AB54E7|nr:hypothetical protein [Xenorhabdus hominickii]